MTWHEDYLDKYYRSRPGWLNGTVEFHSLCRESIPAGGPILEIGAGPTNPTSEFLASIGPVDGVDIDKAVLANRYLKQAHVVTGDRYPYPNESFDACVSNYVLEHIENPLAHFSEVHRVLRPGGSYIFRTPNKFHYVSLVARLTPHWFHELVANRLRRLSDDDHEPYPTYHACNSRREITNLASQVGLQVQTLRLIEKEPSYGMYARGLFLPMMAYERIVNSTERLSGVRSNLLVTLVR